MFNSEAGYWNERRSDNPKLALEYYADINDRTRLYDVYEKLLQRSVNDMKPTRKEKQREKKIAELSLSINRAILDFNAHFVELSNAGESKRSLGFLLAGLLTLTSAIPIFGLAAHFIRHGVLDWFLSMLALAGWAIFYFLFWPNVFAPAFFTALRARYRFNRTTRKVYVLRPKKYGGNAILDWDRVKAHVKWASPKSWTAEQLASSAEARRERQLAADIDGNLLLYWPPLDPADPERKGEDLIWVGPEGSGEPLWQYIRTFMEEGMHAVPQPADYNWLRKGFSTPAQHMRETVMHGSLLRDRFSGQEMSGATATNFGINVLWAPLHSLAERLCYWPTFPEEWNSDCGQRRRESGIGPEEPLRWTARP
ncbi:MAG: MFS transporter [Pseudacidovorax sp.]|nr:MFS transporter [Pseudacidovorax sp.]